MYLALNIVLNLFVASFSLLREPWFIKESTKETFIVRHWKASNALFYLFAGLVSAGVVLTLDTSLYNLILSVSLFITLFLFLQCLFTDFHLRKADRFVLRASMLVSISLGLAYFWGNSTYMSFYIVCLILASVTIFMSSLKVGDSDGRALVVLVATGFPLLLLEWLTSITILFLAVYVIYNSYASYKDKQGFFAKRSVPLVPILLLPNLICYFIVYVQMVTA